ncbi:MAG: hypothetical protein HeimC3_31660 [Candidatus Heimdallarchaeota archaeon LC_3]|nr:MAG: hypothetical protein HeimC3_31660 [Candidatus Heimdallarchaeota archaeon LC_3]
MEHNDFPTEVDSLDQDRDSGVKNVTIRGIDSNTYLEFSKAVKILNMNIGDAITRMMQDVIKDFDGTFPGIRPGILKGKEQLKKIEIEYNEELKISNDDLIQANARISFERIGTLDIKSDVTQESFNKYIREIYRCKNVRVPNILPKLIILSKIVRYEKIEIYDVETNEVIETIVNSSQTVESLKRHRVVVRTPRPPRSPRPPRGVPEPSEAPEPPEPPELVDPIDSDEDFDDEF